MKWEYNNQYPTIEDLRNKAKQNIPRFAFEYMDGGCNEDVNLKKNTEEIREVELFPNYLKPFSAANMKTELFGHVYDAPFGVSPVGLQGLVWPGATEILAKAAHRHNIPFILSTVATASLELISEITENKAWFQLYNPAADEVKNDLINRLEAAHYPVLILLCDVPTFAFRPRDIRNGLAMPPRMTWQNIMQMFGRPNWAMSTLMHGKPEFKNLTPYMPKGLDMKQLGSFMNQTFSGRLDEERIARLRARWKGKLVLKGVATEEDTAMSIKLGLDGIIISNHGGRQLDAGPSTIKSLEWIKKSYQGKIKIMMDSGLRTGPDIARTIAAGAEFTFMARSFMYAVAALGEKGGEHIIGLLKTQLQQVMEQIGCESIGDLHRHLVKQNGR
jgi:L-lactate dehydrogenase (cytochrome)